MLALLLSVVGSTPSFDVSTANITVIEGQNTVLPCSIDDLGEHKVSGKSGRTYDGRRREMPLMCSNVENRHT